MYTQNDTFPSSRKAGHRNTLAIYFCPPKKLPATTDAALKKTGVPTVLAKKWLGFTIQNNVTKIKHAQTAIA